MIYVQWPSTDMIYVQWPSTDMIYVQWPSTDMIYVQWPSTDMIYMQWPSNRHAEIVGDVPYNLYSSKSILMRENKAFAEITGAKVNRGAGYGLEVPCVYHLYGPKVYVDKIKALVESLLADETL